MKAARIHEFGSPDVIRIDDVPQPTASEGEILVRVAAAGVGPPGCAPSRRQDRGELATAVDTGVGFSRCGRKRRGPDSQGGSAAVQVRTDSTQGGVR